MKFTRMAVAWLGPMWIGRAESQGKAALPKSASETRCSSVRDCGPATTKTPRALVRSAKRTDPSAGMSFCR